MRFWLKPTAGFAVGAKHVNARQLLGLEPHHLTRVGKGLAMGDFKVATPPTVGLTRHGPALCLFGERSPLRPMPALRAHQIGL